MKKRIFVALVLLLAVLCYWEPLPTQAQTLPSAGTAGRLGRLSGGWAAGAIVVDDGTDWNCLEAKAMRVLNIACPPYNAVGDNSTNNATAIQAAINDAIADGGTVLIPVGIFRFNTTLLIDGDLVLNSKGFTIRGTSRTESNLVFNGTGPALHLQGKASPAWVTGIVVENLQIRTLTNGNDGILLSGVVFHSIFRNITLLGATASGLGIGILLAGDGGCACFNRFENVDISKYHTAMWFTDNANVNTVQTSATSAVVDGFVWDILAPNAKCHASGNPFTCCTGDGTGTGLDECASDATADRTGYGNTIISADVGADATRNGFVLRDGTHDNVFIGITCDCGTIANCLSVVDNPSNPGFGSNLFVGATYCGAVEIGGTLGASTVFLGGSRSTTGDGEGNSISIGTIPPVVNGELMSLDGYTNYGDVKLDGSSGGCFMMRDRDDAGWTEITFLNGAMSATTDTDGICDGS